MTDTERQVDDLIAGLMLAHGLPIPDMLINHNNLSEQVKYLVWCAGGPYREQWDDMDILWNLQKTVSNEQWEDMKRVKAIEDKLGIKSEFCETEEDRLARIAKKLGIKHFTNTSFSSRIKTYEERVEKMENTQEDKNLCEVVDHIAQFWGITFSPPQPLNVKISLIANYRQIDISNAVSTEDKVNLLRADMRDNAPHLVIHKNNAGYNLLKGFSDFVEQTGELTKDSQNMLKLLPYILKLQAQKSAVYGRSYARHGDLSIFLNTERKWDRITNIMDNAMKEGMGYLYSDKAGTATETFFDTVIDLASYGLLWVGYIMENHPEVFEKFIKDNKLEFQNSD